MKNLASLVIFIFSITILSFTLAINSTNEEFTIEPEIIYLNWSNSYKENLTVTSGLDIIVVFNNSTSVPANYSQGIGINLIVVNNTNELDNTNFINTSSSNSVNFIIIASFNETHMPGRYKGLFYVENGTNSTENASVVVTIDLPIEINSSTGLGYFNGSLPSEAKEYHSFYFNCSNFPNTTSITINVSFDNEELDLFLLVGDTLLAKSINKEGNEEKLSYSFSNCDKIYEIRIYGNNGSGISYNGTLILMALNSSLTKINFGTQNVTNKTLTRILNLTNKGNIPIENVEEKFEIYYIKKFVGDASNNFTFYLPGFPVFEKIKVRLIWNGTGSYNLSIFNSSHELGRSSDKAINANIAKVEKEEFIEINNTDSDNWWRVEVKNTTANLSSYILLIQAFVNSSKWISTNFSSYSNKSFDIFGDENSTKIVKINLTTPPDSISGSYQGFLIYSAENGGELKIPIELNLTNKLNITLAELSKQNVNVSTQNDSVVATLFILFFDGTKIPKNSFNFTKYMNVTLYQPNASYSKKVNFSDASNQTEWKINLTIPEKMPGGNYFIRINLSSDIYVGETWDNLELIVNDTGLFMNASYPSSLKNGTTGVINVTIKNFGPVNATDAKIKLINQSLITNVRFLSTNCQRKSTGQEVTFNISAYNSKGCYVAWEITADKEEGTAILLLNGSAGNWFENTLRIDIPIEKYYETTTTTTIPNITLPSTTVTTTTIPTTTTTTTTTIPKPSILLNESFKINSIEPNVPVILIISKSNVMKIRKIVLFAKRSIQNASVTLKETEKPEGLAPPIKSEEGAVFKYLEIVSGISKEDLENVTIEFQVEKMWLLENDIHPSSIFLYRYDKEWKKLPTRKLNETEAVYIFESVSPSLSLFAIVGERAKGLPFWLTYVFVGAVVAGVLAYLFWPVKEKGTKKEVKAKVEEKEEVKSPWEELKKKWEEFMKRERKSD